MKHKISLCDGLKSNALSGGEFASGKHVESICDVLSLNGTVDPVRYSKQAEHSHKSQTDHLTVLSRLPFGHFPSGLPAQIGTISYL
jgi:hypothetical protein